MSDFEVKKYWENRLNKNFNLEGVGCLGLGEGFNKWLYLVRSVVFKSQVKKVIKDFINLSVLDVGCGTGFYLDQWKKLGVNNITGLDITEVAISGLKLKYPQNTFFEADISGDISKLNKKFDAVSAFDVLFHVVDDNGFEKAIQNINSLLVDKGIFIFSDNFIHGETIRGEHHVSRNIKFIENSLAKNGFEIISRAPMFVLMNYPVDNPNWLVKFIWKVEVKLAQKNGLLFKILANKLYSLELLLVKIVKDSPTTEIMICRKRPSVI